MIAGGKKIELQIKKICWDLLFWESIIRYKIMEKTLTPVCNQVYDIIAFIEEQIEGQDNGTK